MPSLFDQKILELRKSLLSENPDTVTDTLTADPDIKAAKARLKTAELGAMQRTTQKLTTQK